jgi:hypothetical protein
MRKDVNPIHSLLDRRVVERNIRKGIVTREEYQKFLDSLGDAAANAETMRARLGEDDEPVAAAALDDDSDDEDDEDDDDAEDDDDDAG